MVQPMMEERLENKNYSHSDLETLLKTETQAFNNFSVDIRSLRTSIANPAPTGLIAFGFTTIFSMMMVVGAVSKNSSIILQAYATFHGGILQLVAGMWEFKRGNIFGATVFSAYGVFWITDTSIMFLTTQLNGVLPQDGKCLWLCLWALFTLAMGMGTFHTNRVLQFVFTTLFLTFVFLAGGVYVTVMERVAGVVGIICGLSATYLGWAEVMNDVYDHEWIPIWPVKRPNPPLSQAI